ncbi:YdiY family protein [Sphingomonas sp. 179-I 2A4 NHS]|uniref:YdiY family protein n=1 Tax=unclassified Sphingomonas TaxID=196159 RepID=UPI0038792E78
MVAPAEPADIPAPIRAMLEAAIASGNEGEVTTIVKYARTADPASGDAVLRIANDWRSARARERQTRIQRAGLLDLWSGRAEVGGFINTGNSETAGVIGILDLTREGLDWRHKLRAQGDYQRSLGVTTREQYLFAYEPNWKIDARRYVYGAAQFESDRFLGYNQRYSASAGAGYSPIKTSAVSLNLELGPAFRHTEFTDDTVESSLAARGNLDLDLKLSPGLTFTQDASAYLQRYNSTVSSSTALAARLIGPLSARVSYTVQYESMPPLGRVSTDTTSRASLVYTF